MTTPAYTEGFLGGVSVSLSVGVIMWLAFRLRTKPWATMQTNFVREHILTFDVPVKITYVEYEYQLNCVSK
jgi:F0F1-type ATP synthase assembly protein I